MAGNLIYHTGMHSSRELRSSSFEGPRRRPAARIGLDEALGLLGSTTPAMAG
jgi:hypothetical protein